MLKLTEKFRHFNEWIYRLFKNKFFVGVFVFLFIVIVTIFSARSFLVNDDIGILFDLSGGFSVSYMSVLLGQALSFFYVHVFQDFPWYGLFLYLVHIISLVLFISSLAKLEKIKNYFLLILVGYLSFYVFFLNLPSYNNTSILIGANSLSAFLIYLTLKDSKKSLMVAFGFGFLFSFCYLIRIDALMAVLLFCFPVFLYFLLINLKKYRYFIAFSLPIIAIIVINLILSNYFTSSQYKNFVSFRKVLGQMFIGTTLSANQGNDEILTKNSWSKNDYTLLGNWFYFDETKFNKNSLENILRYSVPIKQNKIFDFTNYRNTASIDYRTYQNLILFLGLIFLLSLLCRSKRSPIMALYLMYSALAVIYMETFLRFPPRIGDPLFLSVAAMSLALVFTDSYKSSKLTVKPHIKFAFIFLLILLILTNFWQFREVNKNTAKSQNEFREDLSKLNAKFSSSTFVIPEWSLNFQYLDPLKKMPKISFKKIEGGWPTFSPRFYASLKDNLGLDNGRAMVKEMATNDNIYLIEPENSPVLSSLPSYYKETYNLNIELKKVDNLSAAGIYRVISK